jgi:serine/threonine protein kinase/tetratricopeptide (TPR) repeat protein
MALASGIRLGCYEIIAPIGAGGMGEVYRARDTRLDRLVAIKALPQEFARDPDRLARFEREAKHLASLDHPNIAGIHGVEESDHVPYLVLEFVAGETLADRIARGPIPLVEALAIGSQVASAVEAAHARGIVHRDLKPGNVMLTPAGSVKVLDFGIAKGGFGEAMTPEGPEAPTVGVTMTGPGVVIGTAGYMSPEQARGLVVDKRTDVWAFGCLLYECLAGRPAFAGGTSTDVIARVLEREPDWNAVPRSAPLRELLRRCLTKDRASRAADMRTLRRELAALAKELSPQGSEAGRGSGANPSLAVLYFENLSSDTESDYFCAGITEDILTDLSKIKGMRVASRNAVARYRGAAADIPRIAGELNVGAVLEGSVRRAGGRVRITAQLINAADGFHLWAERYDRTLEDVFAVQEEIASSIAAALRVALTPAESEDLRRNRPSSVGAYDLYLKGRELYAHYTQGSLARALELFQQAATIEPDYALAWAGIADCYGQMVQWGGATRDDTLIRRGLEAARRAIALDPRLAEGHKAEGLVLTLGGQREQSLASLRRAVEANPRYTPAIINLALADFEKADLAGAERGVRRVLSIDPQESHSWMWLAQICFATRRDEDAIEATRRLEQVAVERLYVTSAHYIRSAVHLRRGELDAAAREIRAGRAAGAEPANMRLLEATISWRAGRLEEAARWLDEVEASPGIDQLALVLGAEAAVGLGNKDRALRFLGRPMATLGAPIFARLTPGLHPVLELPPFAPRRSSLTLVWPAEAPPPEPAIRELFAEARTESGLPQP